MPAYEIGRLLRAGTTGFVAGCAVSQFEMPTFGALVRAPVNTEYVVYGLIHDIRIDDDGLVKQLVTANNVSEEVILDNRQNRIVPVEMSVISIGYEKAGIIYHLLPPYPPFSLDKIFLCDDQEIERFSDAGNFGYFRHILRAKDFPAGELLAAHIQQTSLAHDHDGNAWIEAATRELITLLRDDYPVLMSVLGALKDIT